MKFRYYLRGAGVGIIVTTVILMIAFHNNKPTMSAEEIKAEAEKLGMVMSDEEVSDSTDEDALKENTDKDNVENNESDKDSNDLTEDKDSSAKTDDTENTGSESSDNSNVEQEYVTLTVERGDSSEMVTEKLLKLGLIEDEADFNHWLCEVVKKDDNVLIGTFQIPKGATYDEIIAIITG